MHCDRPGVELRLRECRKTWLIMSAHIKYSIITAVYNGKKYLSRLMASVFQQSYPHIEWIVQDGGSTDGTLELLRPYENRIRLVSEPDTGVYDAWNKGIARAPGDWALFLGADDFLLSPNTIAQCHRHVQDLPPNIDMAFGALFMGRDGKPKGLVKRTLCQAYHMMLMDVGIPFPATFTRVPLLQRVGFDPSFKIAGDYDMVARVLTDDNLARIPIIVSYMEMGGISGTRNNCTLLEERMRILFQRIAPKARIFMEACANHLLDDDEKLEDTLQ